jgi:hypothetical protein
MSETRKIAAILVSDVVGYSRLAGADEDRALARLRAIRSDLIDPIIAVHNGRVVKRSSAFRPSVTASSNGKTPPSRHMLRLCRSGHDGAFLAIYTIGQPSLRGGSAIW